METCNHKTCHQKDGTFSLDSCIALHTPFVIMGYCDIYNSLFVKKAKKKLVLGGNNGR